MELIAGREILWNVSGVGAIRLLSVAAFAAFGYGMYRRYSAWRLGRPAGRFDRAWYRAKSAAALVLGHGRILRRPLAGWMHLSIFWGMAALFAGTIMVAIQQDFGIRILQGKFYLGFKLAMDTAGLGALAGLSLSCVRRYVRREEGLDTRPGDWAVIALLAGILLTGFLVGSLRIASTGDPWGAWSPVGYALAEAFRGIPGSRLIETHRVAWIVHVCLCFGLIACIPFSKMIHIFTAPLNAFLRPLTPSGALDRLDLEDDRIRRFGAGTLEEFTWKDLFDADACVRCGRCQANCPASATGKPLSPMEMMRGLKVQMASGGRTGGGTAAKPLVDGVIGEDALWACTTCGACMEQCPVFVEHIPKIAGMRRSLVLMESRFPPELNAVFRNMEHCGNPWGLSQAKRAEWAGGSGVEAISKDGAPEYLFWVGCAGSFDDRNRRVAAAVAGILKHAGIRFAILGSEERCCGDSARRLGNEYLFQVLVRWNVETLRKFGIRKILTQCPHCYNTLKNEYPQFGWICEVIHHTELIARLVESGVVKAGDGGKGSVTYQDPCYMGRHNGEYRAPREILKSMGFRPAEMSGHMRESHCCGAGGGRIWMEESLGERINARRTDHAIAVDPEAVVTGCPYCLTMMEDGIKLKEKAGQIRTMDIAELVSETMRR